MPGTLGADCISPDDIDSGGARNAPLPDMEKAKAKWTKMEALIGSRQRIKNLAKDIVSHFDARQEVFAGKGMIVSMSRRIAAELYQEITLLKPEWHSDDLNKGVIPESRSFLLKIFSGILLEKIGKNLTRRFILLRKPQFALDQYRPRPNKGIANIAPMT